LPPPAPPVDEIFHQDVAWSPDGKWLAFSEYRGGSNYREGGWTVQVARADGSEQRELATNGQFVTWHPNGEWIAFGSARNGDWDIYAIGLDGAGPERLTTAESDERAPAWSPDGAWLAFASNRDGNSEIYARRLSDGRETRITRNPANDYNPAWSPDGKELVFYREVGDGIDQILTARLDGSGERPVTADSALNTFPSYLPDGALGFASKPSGGRSVLIVAEGSRRRQVGQVEAFLARWSPDGKRIAFIAGTWPRSAIYVMDASGARVRKIVN
jgi:Tol biopolymer transport system component